MKFVSDLRVSMNIVYRDRHDVEVEEDDLSSPHFDQDDYEQNTLSDDDMISAFSNYEAKCEIEDAVQVTTDLDYESNQGVKDGSYDPENNDGHSTNDVFDDDNHSIVVTCGSNVAKYDADKSDLDETFSPSFNENFVGCEEGDENPGSV